MFRSQRHSVITNPELKKIMFTTNETTPPPATANIKFHGLPPSEKWKFLVQSFMLALGKEVKLDRAEVVLKVSPDQSPSFESALNLEVPGPDVVVSARGATLLEAWKKSCDAVKAEIKRRQLKRKMREPRVPMKRAFA